MSRKREKNRSNDLDRVLVKVDLSAPDLRESLKALEKLDRVNFESLVRKVQTLTWAQVYRNPGIKWEAVKQPLTAFPDGVDRMYSARFSRSRRVLAYRRDEYMIFLLIRKDHDATYTVH